MIVTFFAPISTPLVAAENAAEPPPIISKLPPEDDGDTASHCCSEQQEFMTHLSQTSIEMPPPLQTRRLGCWPDAVATKPTGLLEADRRTSLFAAVGLLATFGALPAWAFALAAAMRIWA
jgi:hypothetical protein